MLDGWRGGHTHQFWNKVWYVMGKEIRPSHVPKSSKCLLVPRLIPLFWVKTIRFQLRKEMKVLSLAKPSSWIGVKISYIFITRGANLETKLLEIRHMSRPNFFYLYLIKLHYKTAYSEHEWPPHDPYTCMYKSLSPFPTPFWYQAKCQLVVGQRNANVTNIGRPNITLSRNVLISSWVLLNTFQAWL